MKDKITIDYGYGVYHNIEDIKLFSPGSYFNEYDHFHIINKDDEYTSDYFTKDFGKGIKTYKYKCYTIRDPNTVVKYIAARECISKAEKNKLKKHCRCAKCTRSKFNPMKYLLVSTYCCCLHTGCDSQYIINKTRKYMKKHNL